MTYFRSFYNEIITNWHSHRIKEQYRVVWQDLKLFFLEFWGGVSCKILYEIEITP